MPCHDLSLFLYSVSRRSLDDTKQLMFPSYHTGLRVIQRRCLLFGYVYDWERDGDEREVYGFHQETYRLRHLIHGPGRPFVPSHASHLRPIQWHCSILRQNLVKRCRMYSLFHLFRNLLVYCITEVLDRTLTTPQYDRRTVVWGQTARFRVCSHEVERFPHLLNELVHVEPLPRGDGHGHGDFV